MVDYNYASYIINSAYLAYRVWHDTAIPFEDVLREFELWMSNHHLWKKETGGSLHRAAFVTW